MARRKTAEQIKAEYDAKLARIKADEKRAQKRDTIALGEAMRFAIARSESSVEAVLNAAMLEQVECDRSGNPIMDSRKFFTPRSKSAKKRYLDYQRLRKELIG